MSDRLARALAGGLRHVIVDRWAKAALEPQSAVVDASRDSIQGIGPPRAVFVRKVVTDPVREDVRHELGIVSRYIAATYIGVARKGFRVAPNAAFISIPAPGPPLVGGFLFRSLASFVAVLLSVGRPRSAIVCWSVYDAFGVLLLSRLLPKEIAPTVVVEVHGDWRQSSRLYGHRARRLLAPLADRVAVWALRRADRVRVVSNSTERLVGEVGFVGAIDQFPHFNGTLTFLTSPSTPVPVEPRVAFVGGLELVKGVDVLIDAWCFVMTTNPRARLQLVGTGTLLAYLRSKIATLGLEDSVTLTGFLSRSEVFQVLDDARCLVLPSRSEGMPLVVLEAMARGRPVIASTVGGVTELVEHGYDGLLVPPGDAESLAERLLQVLSDHDLAQALGREGRRRVLERDPGSEFETGVARLAAWIEDQGT